MAKGPANKSGIVKPIIVPKHESTTANNSGGTSSTGARAIIKTPKK